MGTAVSRRANSPEQQPQQSSSPNTNKKPLHKFQEILNQGEVSADEEKVRDKGIFLAKKTKKYWVDGKGNNCFTIFPRGMSIIWVEDSSYWAWKTVKEDDASEAGEIDVAELLNVCWLEIHGMLELSYLNPEVTYEVILEVKLEDHADGWDIPVDLQLKLPDGRVQERKEILENKPKGEWLPLTVGEIQARREQNGDVVVSLFQHGGHWKSGLVIRGIIIRTKE